jgi:hypothetical protein
MPLGPEAKVYLGKLFSNVEKAWKIWSDQIMIGPLLVTGAGIGAWVGAGSGAGLIPGPPMKTLPLSFQKNSPEQVKFTTEIFTAIDMKFNAWLPTYKFSSVPYVGTSGASPITPGPVTAVNTSGPLAGYGKGSPLKGIAETAKAKLLPPMFKLKDPQAKSGELVDAIGKAIETAFETTWLTSTMVTGSQLVTGGLAGGVVTALPSTPGGKLV